MANKTQPKTRPKKTGKTARDKAPRVKGKGGTPMSKAGFIRSMPTTPAQEIIRLYKEKYGPKAKIAVSLIYNVRASEKKKAANGPVTEKTPPTKKKVEKVTSGTKQPRPGTTRVTRVALHVSNPPSRESSGDRVVSQFRSSVIRLGLDQAEVLLEQFRASLEIDEMVPAPRTPMRQKPARLVTTESTTASEGPSQPAEGSQVAIAN
jgi:hypothetical protein